MESRGKLLLCVKLEIIEWILTYLVMKLIAEIAMGRLSGPFNGKSEATRMGYYPGPGNWRTGEANFYQRE